MTAPSLSLPLAHGTILTWFVLLCGLHLGPKLYFCTAGAWHIPTQASQQFTGSHGLVISRKGWPAANRSEVEASNYGELGYKVERGVQSEQSRGPLWELCRAGSAGLPLENEQPPTEHLGQASSTLGAWLVQMGSPDLPTGSRQSIKTAWRA